MIKITCDNFSVPEKEEYKAPFRPVNLVKNPPRPYIASINNAGLIKVAFSQELIIPSYNLYPEFKRSAFMRNANASSVWNETQPVEHR